MIQNPGPRQTALTGGTIHVGGLSNGWCNIYRLDILIFLNEALDLLAQG
jgi:hypothetical protein